MIVATVVVMVIVEIVHRIIVAFSAERLFLKAEWFAHLVKRTKEVNGMDDRQVVWSNENLNLEEWRADLEEEYPGY